MDKTVLTAQDLLEDSFKLGLQILESGFEPTLIIAIWRLIFCSLPASFNAAAFTLPGNGSFSIIDAKPPMFIICSN